VALIARGRRGAALVGRREGRDGDAPGHGARLVERRLGGEAGEAGAHRHRRRAGLGFGSGGAANREISGLLSSADCRVLGGFGVELVICSSPWQLIWAVYLYPNGWKKLKGVMFFQIPVKKEFTASDFKIDKTSRFLQFLINRSDLILKTNWFLKETELS
jgi:hypothetical protein